MADYHIAYRIVHGHEGGYANNPADNGGETYAGISRRYNPRWAGWQLVDAWKAGNGAPKRGAFIPGAGLANLVLSFYRASWQTMGGDALASQPVANLLYDFYTNSGGAIEVAQGVLVQQFGRQLKVDNTPGPATTAAINAVDYVAFHNALKAARIAYLREVAKKPGQAVFLNTWLARCASFADLQKKTAL